MMKEKEKLMKKRNILALVLALLMIFALFGCAKQEGGGSSGYKIDKKKDTIVFGGSRSMTGVYAFFEQSAYGPIYKMWVNDVNADGGIYVKEYGKKMKIELKVYDDTSDLSTMTRNLEKAIVEDQVDFILPPVSTAFLYAAAPIANKYGKVLVGAEGGSASLKESIAKYPYFFSSLNFSDTQAPALAAIFEEQGITSAYVVYIEDLHGTEYSQAVIPALVSIGCDIKGVKSVPADIQDMTSIIQDAQNTGADAFLCLTYPDQGFLALNQSIALEYNPKVWFMGSGGGFSSIMDIYGKDTVEGIMSWGAWNTKSSPACAEYFEHFKEYWKDDPNVYYDYWGLVHYYAGLQCLQKAIEGAGTLDNEKVRDYLANNHFDTVIGDTWFENNLIAGDCFMGNVGQWQDGVFEVIDRSDKATSDPVVPKQPWPKG